MIPKPSLDAKSEVPLYRQLYDYFGQLIHSGHLANGDRLPATRELAGVLGLNRTTVAAAYELLETDGFITAQVGRGTFVTGGRIPGQLGLDWESLLTRSEADFIPAPALAKNGISFASSRPAEQLFPLDAFRASCDEVMAGPDFASVLQLGSPAGYEPLRQYLLQEGRRQGVIKRGDDLIITSGCQQALDLIARLLVQPGDKVALEDPVYPGWKLLFAQAKAQLLGISVGEHGIDLEELKRVVERERPKMLVVTSNFQNPTGATLPSQARGEILRLAGQNGLVVVENDIYGELRYTGEPVTALKRMDDAGQTVLLRSFSKLAFPGLRIGWVIGPRALISRLAQAKQLTDLHTDHFSQAVMLRFAESGRLEAHHARVLQAGAERLTAVLEACARYLPASAYHTRPQGGMNLWVRLPPPLDAGELLIRAQRENVAYLPGKYFSVSRPEPGGLRLSFAGLTPDKILKGLSILGEIFSSEVERTRAPGNMEPAPAMV